MHASRAATRRRRPGQGRWCWRCPPHLGDAHPTQALREACLAQDADAARERRGTGDGERLERAGDPRIHEGTHGRLRLDAVVWRPHHPGATAM
eukprot:1070835-Prymnesium_polylepis.1